MTMVTNEKNELIPTRTDTKMMSLHGLSSVERGHRKISKASSLY